jgi:hypothetical protein
MLEKRAKSLTSSHFSGRPACLAGGDSGSASRYSLTGSDLASAPSGHLKTAWHWTPQKSHIKIRLLFTISSGSHCPYFPAFVSQVSRTSPFAVGFGRSGRSRTCPPRSGRAPAAHPLSPRTREISPLIPVVYQSVSRRDVMRSAISSGSSDRSDVATKPESNSRS